MIKRETTLSEIYNGKLPSRDEMIWEFVGQIDFNKKLSIIKVNPTEIWNKWTIDENESIRNVYRKYATKEQKRLVKETRESKKW